MIFPRTLDNSLGNLFLRGRYSDVLYFYNRPISFVHTFWRSICGVIDLHERSMT
jgi:hypothetical protein